jgi:hypothetical protein
MACRGGETDTSSCRSSPVKEPSSTAPTLSYKNKSGELVVEDAKGIKTKDYVIKLMLAVHGIRISEV